MIHCVLIPAFEETGSLPDILLKKLDGRTLVDWAVRKGKALANDVFVLTNSEQIGLVAERAGAQALYPQPSDKKGFLSGAIASGAGLLPSRISKVILLWPFTPNLPVEAMRQAFAKSKTVPKQMAVISTQLVPERKFHFVDLNSVDLFSPNESHMLQVVKGFCILDRSLLEYENTAQVIPEILSSDTIEIRSYQDLWVCEKLLRRKRIVFRVIGSPILGMGHIYRSLALAHEVNDHEIIFVCDEESMLAARSIAATDYRLEVFPAETFEDKLLELAPDMVVNDVLDTNNNYMDRLKKHGILTCNFEDLGPGADLADMVVNELYDTPIRSGTNYLWGYEYYFLRDEFLNAKVNKFQADVTSVLITYGGTDLNDLTRATFRAILPMCKARSIHISIITGGGYAYRNELLHDLEIETYKKVDFSHATNVISKIMERSQVAFTSNGRTTYELAHMHIPAVVTAQNEREATHHFATQENGFINVGVYQKGRSEKRIAESFLRMLDPKFRRTLYNNMSCYDFCENKSRVLKRLLSLFEKSASYEVQDVSKHPL